MEEILKSKKTISSKLEAPKNNNEFILIPVEEKLENYKNKLIRFHVIANSDSEEDQNLKLKVRDGIIDYLQPKLLESI